MNLLALETSTLACSVALQCDDDVLVRHELEPRQHTTLLLPMINELFGETGLQPADLDAVVLGNGPGSFIGMRIAASVAQGLCFAADIPLVPVSSLAVVAAAAFDNPHCERVLVAQDARMHEVYLEGYQQGADGLPEVILDVRLQPVGPIPSLEHPFCAAGFGWRQYPPLWTENETQLQRLLDIDYPHARDLLRIGAARREQGAAINAEMLEPAYVRERVAAKPRGSAAP